MGLGVCGWNAVLLCLAPTRFTRWSAVTIPQYLVKLRVVTVVSQHIIDRETTTASDPCCANHSSLAISQLLSLLRFSGSGDSYLLHSCSRVTTSTQAKQLISQNQITMPSKSSQTWPTGLYASQQLHALRQLLGQVMRPVFFAYFKVLKHGYPDNGNAQIQQEPLPPQRAVAGAMRGINGPGVMPVYLHS